VLLNAMAKYPEKVWIRMAIVAGTYREQPLNLPELVEPFETLEGVPFLQGFENGLRAVAALIRYGEFQERWQAQRGRTREQENGRTGDQERKERALALVRGAGAGGPTEAEGKELLTLYGIATPRECLATSAGDAVAAAKSLGFPVVLKIVSPQIQHKTEAGGVLLNVADEAAVAAGYEQIVASARRYNADADIQGISVQEMVQGGRELIVGMNNDPQFGPAVVVGLGGIFVEILKDSALRIPPLTPDDAREMVTSLKGYPLLAGARGLAHLDVDAVVETLCAFSQLCLDLKDEVAEIDINPLVVLPKGQGVRAVDCLVVRKDG
jgi:acetyltransferase